MHTPKLLLLILIAAASGGSKASLDTVPAPVPDTQDAGEALKKMLAMSAARPWQEALFALTGQREMDASAILEYFGPLQMCLEDQNKGEQCGW